MGRINYQLLNKIEKQRKANRDEIRHLIRNKQFYRIGIDYKVCSMVLDLASSDKESNYHEMKEIYHLSKTICQHLKCENGKITSGRVYAVYNGVPVSQISSNHSEKIDFFYRAIISELSYNDKTSIYYAFNEEELKLPILQISALPDKYCRIDYKNFDHVKNYPNNKLKGEDQLAKIISPYYFTGYEFYLQAFHKYSIDMEFFTNSSNWFENNTKYLQHTPIPDLMPLKEFSSSDKMIQDYGTVALLLPDKYKAWHFTTDM